MPLNIQNIDKILAGSGIAHSVKLSDVNNTGVKVCKLDGDYPFHSHDSDEIFVILKGQLIMDYKDGDSFSLKTGDVMSVPAGQHHRTRTNIPSRVLLVGPK